MKNKLLVLSILTCSIINANEINEVTLDTSNIVSQREFGESMVKENKNIILITQERIREKNYKNVEEVLKDAPGVIVNNTAFGPRIDMRGSGEKSLSRVKIMIDGVSINPTEEAMASLPINSIPVESIRKIEIIPGGGATLYGSGSVGGVINISTNSNATKNNFFMDLNYGSYDNRSIGFAGGYNVNDSLYVNYGFNYINSEGYRELEQKENQIFLGGFDYKINKKNRIRFQTRKGKENNNGTNELKKSILENNRKAPGLNLDLETESESYTLDYEYRYSDKLTFASTFYRQKQDRIIDTESIDDIFIILSARRFSDIKDYYNFYDVKSLMDAKFKETKEGIKLKTKYEYSNGEIILGYDYSNAKINRNSKVVSETLKSYYDGEGSYINLNPNDRKAVKNKVNIDLKKESHGIYVFNKYDITKKFNFTTGLRSEFTSYNGSRVNGPNEMPFIFPKIQSIETDRTMENYAGEFGALYKYSELGNIYARYERGFVTPFPSQLTDKIHDNKLKTPGPTFFEPPIVNVSSIYVDNNLEPEITDTIEIGVRDYIYNSYMSLAFFVTDTRDEITLIQSGVTNPAIKRWQYKNIGKTRRMGIEAETEQSFGDFRFNQSLTLIDAKILKGNDSAQINKDDKIPLVPRTKVTLGAKYNITDNLAVSGTYTYIGNKEARELSETDKSFKFKIGSYGVTDVALSYKFDEYSSLRAGVKNLTATKYNLRETSIEAAPAPERNYYIGLNVKF